MEDYEHSIGTRSPNYTLKIASLLVTEKAESVSIALILTSTVVNG